MLAQAIGVSVVGEDEPGRGEVLPHHHGAALRLDHLYRPPEDAGEGEQLHLAAPLGGGGHLVAVDLELLGGEREEGEVLGGVGPELRGGLLPQLRHAAGLATQRQLVSQTWGRDIINCWYQHYHSITVSHLRTCSLRPRE